ncbi:hypothetical protein PpBr36_03184 [Pyricularia pennisetigena]|uniref:hypothetical protein n=1 Tax=Pyricularia pennisetigena TaxID=1578925 RepID=UPI0011527B91|nr:hypothetical protein PpBr36_03184 [Pyricularia pennisetigena]TLS30877.1 hypothetical protein PpBr36_03184 [Pyricularia pennisetigena]
MASDNNSHKSGKLGVANGVYIPVCLNIVSILMFLRFGSILGHIGVLGMLGLLVVSYLIDLVTVLSLSAVASNGVVKGGGAYYLISRSLGPEFGGSIGILFYLSQVLNTALNVVGLISCLELYFVDQMPHGFWGIYLLETAALVGCTAMCLAGSGIFAKASNALLAVLLVSTFSIPLSALFLRPFSNPDLGIEFTGLSMATLQTNLFPDTGSDSQFQGLSTFRELFGILFPATSGIFAGASMSGDLRNPSKAIPKGTLWAMLSTFVIYLLVILSMASAITQPSLLRDANILQDTTLSAPLILAGECATTFFSALMGLIGSAKLLQALARDKLIPGLSPFGLGTKKGDEPMLAIFLTYMIAQVSLFADLDQIATFISMGYQLTFFTMNLACFLLKIGSAPNFRPAFKFFSWHTAFAGSILSASAMFFIDETYATIAVILLVFLFLLIHYLSPPKHWGDVSQNLIYHQVRKYLLRLRPEHIKFWRPQIILLVGDPRRQTRLVQFCNSMKKGSLYILGHVIVTDDFETGVKEAKLQQSAWTKYISEYSRIKAFVQLNMSPTITWGIRNLILSAGLGGMRPNIAVIGFFNMDELRKLQAKRGVQGAPELPRTGSARANAVIDDSSGDEVRPPMRRRRDTSARLLDGDLPTDIIKREGNMSVTSYLTILEDLAFRYRLNVAVAKGFDRLETPRRDGKNSKKYIDLWPIQMSARVHADGKNVITSNFDTYTLILQLGYILHTCQTWRRVFKLRVMVFVEYASEVQEEKQRVSTLLEKLRIDAKVHAFSLDSDELHTYHGIVHGDFKDPQIENMLNKTLESDWWAELKAIRLSQNQGSDLDHQGDEPGPEVPRRRSTISYVSGMSRTPNESGSESSSSSDDEIDADFNEPENDGNISGIMESPRSRISLANVRLQRSSFGSLRSNGPATQRVLAIERQPLLRASASARSYGAVSAEDLARASDDLATTKSYEGRNASISREDTLAATQPPSRTRSPTRESRTLKPEAGTVRRPGFSRASSSNRFVSSLVPETKIIDGEGAAGPSLGFASPVSEPADQSNTGLAATGGAAVYDVKIDIPELVAAQQKGQGGRSRSSSHHNDDAGGESESQQGSQDAVKLSFNDLPSRAQHLIINELMRQHSGDTAVLFTTLPIPEEGISESEEASVQYLSDVERGCARLPTSQTRQHHDGEIRIDLPLLFFTSSSHCAQRAVMEIKSKPRGFYGGGNNSSRSRSRSRSRNSNSSSSKSASGGRRDKSSSRQRSKLREFVPVHTPDRPTHPVTDIPSDEECYAILSGIQAHNIQGQSRDPGAARVATWSVRGESALPHAGSPTPSPPPYTRAVSTESSEGDMAPAVENMVDINDIMKDFEGRRHPKAAPSPRNTMESHFSSIYPVSPESTLRMQPEVTAWPGSAAANTFQRMRQHLSPSPPESECPPDQAEQQTWSFQATATNYRDNPGVLPSPAESLSIPPEPPALSKQALSLYNRESVYPDALTPTRWNTEYASPRSAPPFARHAFAPAAASPPRPWNQMQIACSTNGEQICRLCRKPGMMGGGALCLGCENSYLPVTSGVFGENTRVSPDSDQERGRVRRRQDDDSHHHNVSEKPFSLGPPPPRRKGIGRTAKASPRGPRAQREDSSREVSPTPARVGVARGISIKAAMQSPKKIKLVSPGFRPGGFPGFPRTSGESGGGGGGGGGVGGNRNKSSPSRDTSAVHKAVSASPLRFGEALDPLQRDTAQGEARGGNATLDDWTDDWEGFDYYFEPKDTSEGNEGHLATSFQRKLPDVEEASSGSESEDQVPALEPSPISSILSKLHGRERKRILRPEQPLATRFFTSPEPAFF